MSKHGLVDYSTERYCRPCSLALKPEECITLKSPKLRCPRCHSQVRTKARQRAWRQRKSKA